MARKRITEQDLIDFGKRMDELSGVVEEKYNRMDERKQPEQPQIKHCGVLMLRSSRSLAALLELSGIAVGHFDVETALSAGNKDATPLWSRAVNELNSSFEALNAEEAFIYAPGDSLAQGLLLAAQYSVKAVFTNGGTLQSAVLPLSAVARIRSKISAIARKNLFQVTAPIYISGENSRQLQRFLKERTRSEKTEVLPNGTDDDIIALIKQISVV